MRLCRSRALRWATTARARTSTSRTAFVSGCYQLGTVLDGTWKKFTQEADRKVGGTGRIKLGTESNGGFRNISISNCVFEGCQGLALETVDGALLEDITVTNITMRDIISCPIFMRLGARLRGPKGAGDQSTVVGTLQRVLISGHQLLQQRGAVMDRTLPAFRATTSKDVKISDVYVQHAGGGTAEQTRRSWCRRKRTRIPEPGMLGTLPAHGFYLRHVNRLEMSHVEVEPLAPDARPAIYTDDVHRADFFAITAPSSPPAFSFNKSDGHCGCCVEQGAGRTRRSHSRLNGASVGQSHVSEFERCGHPPTHAVSKIAMSSGAAGTVCARKGGRGLLYWLLYQKLFPYFRVFRIFRYLTFRTVFASLTALLIGLLIGPFVIERLREFQIGQYVRDDGPQTPPEEGRHADHGRGADRASRSWCRRCCGRPVEPGGVDGGAVDAGVWRRSGLPTTTSRWCTSGARG